MGDRKLVRSLFFGAKWYGFFLFSNSLTGIHLRSNSNDLFLRCLASNRAEFLIEYRSFDMII